LVAEAYVVIPNPVGRRPIFRLIRGQASFYRVDAEGEELVKVRIKGRKTQRFPKKIPIKGLQMAKIKYYPVAFRDRAVVQCCGADDLEEFFASPTRNLEARRKLIDAGRWRNCCRIHKVSRTTDLPCSALGKSPDRSGKPYESTV